MDDRTTTTRPATKAYSVKTFCEAYGVSRTFAYKLMNDGQLQFVQVRRRRLIPADAAERLLQGVN